MTQTLDQLSAAATQGEWVADNHVIMLSPATTVACLENFNQWGDSKPTGNEANDAAFICQLVNLYRTGQIVAVTDDAIERVARSLCEHHIREVRRHDTTPEKLEAMIKAAVDYAWQDFVNPATAAIAAMKDTQP